MALYKAHWRLKGDVEPSPAWRDLTLLLLEKHRLDEAVDVAGRITDVYVLVGIRADRRFDAVVAANRSEFDSEEAAKRELEAFQVASENAPNSLKLRNSVIDSLLRQRRYEAALGAADSILSDIKSTNYPEKLYEDYGDEHSFFLDLRSRALEGVGRWDEAVAQLSAASRVAQKYGGNVDQLINLADLYCSLGRPKDALSAIGRLTAKTSAYGAMQLERVRLDAAVQLGDSKQIARSMQYLREHRADQPLTYQTALLVESKPDLAAQELIRQLRDANDREEALLSVQDFQPSPATPRDTQFEARRRSVLDRPDVRKAIDKVGRVERYSLENPLF